MREIKLRAWDNLRKQMCNVMCLNCHRNEEHILQRKEPIPCTSNDCYNIDADAIDLMQYTGLKDKNGVEIYEGDVVKFKASSMSPYEREMKDKDRVVVYSNYTISGFVLDTIDGETVYSGKGLCTTNAKFMEVIGNIHENPELLGEKI